MVIGAAFATLVAVPAVAFTIWGVSRNKKKVARKNLEIIHNKNGNPDDGGKNNGEQDSKTKNQKGKYYEENVKMIREQSEMSDENVEKLIDLIDDESNGFLDNICSIFSFEDYKWYKNNELTKEIIEKAGVTKGKSWVEKFFGILRGNAKIYQIKNLSEKECIIYTTAESDSIGFYFYNNDDGDGAEIQSSDSNYKVCCRLTDAC